MSTPASNSRKLKMLWICYSRILESSETFGSERIERLRHLAEDGHEELLMTAYFNKDRYASLRSKPRLKLISIPLRHFPVVSTLLYGFFLFVFAPIYVLKERPDIIIADHFTAPYLIWHPILSRIFHFKTVLDIRSTPVSGGTKVPLGSRLQFNFSVWLAKSFFDGMTVVTPMMQQEICQKFGINPSGTSVLSNGISDEVLLPEKEKDAGLVLREQLDLSSKFIVIYHGSFRLTGGIIESAKAIALLKARYPDIVLFFLGQGTKEMGELLNCTIKENNLEHNVIVHGPVQFFEVPKFIAMSNLGLVPLPNIPFWRYQQPIKLLEYLAMNKTVIVAESPANRIIVSNTENVIYIPDVTPEEIAKAIEFAYKNKDKLDEWGSIGREIVEKKYVWKKVNKGFVSYLWKVKNSRANLRDPT